MWDLQNKVELHKPSQMQNAWDPITCAAWLTLEDKRNNILCCGTGLGYVLFWMQNLMLATPDFKEMVARWVGTGQEIMAINWCKGSDQLLWTVGAKHTLTNIFSIELPTTVPHAIYFYGADILMFGMYDGEIHTLHGKDGIVLVTKTISRMMNTLRGNAAIDAAHTSFVIDNAVNGFSLHRIEDGICTRTYDTNPRKGFPKQVAIVEGGSMVVATLSNENDISISVWKKLATSSKWHQKKRGGLTALTALHSVWQALPHLTALAVIVMFMLQMRRVQGEDQAVIPLSWKGNLPPIYPTQPRGIIHTDVRLHGENNIEEGSTGHGNDAAEEYECDGPITTEWQQSKMSL
ncbi:hypothetical protein EDC04DRAFT_2610421 [Pisolithus marmoratus]|nr:hypothetical protein EDC04DRAFT_2610421 [Pisolithus marmoratus]